mgnify:CR=1 FL=1|tara:strand:- start:95 stop:454 length:360 start_codon:yes stop_codon:yes gene_type:complete
MLYTKQKALYSLKPNASWSWSGDDYSGLEYNGGDTAPTESEINAELTRLTNAEAGRLLRVERDKRLSKCDWRASSDLTLPDNWKTYRQALRDLPASSTPKVDAEGNFDMTSVTFPTEPS